MKKIVLTAALITSLSPLTACMGQMGLTQMTTGVNLKAVDNRYARAGIYFVAAPVYGLTATADVLVFNTIEFWSGENILNEKSPVVDMEVDSWGKINQYMPEETTESPLTMMGKPVKSTELKAANEQVLQIEITFEDGSNAMAKVAREDKLFSFYIDEQLIAQGTKQELNHHISLAVKSENNDQPS